MKVSLVRKLGAGAIATFATAGIVQAQYTGPSSNQITTVAEALKNAKDNSYLQLQGKILKKVGNEKYIFADKSGEIRVEIDNKVFSVPVDEKTTVEIRGEFEKDFLQSPEIDVDSIVVK